MTTTRSRPGAAGRRPRLHATAESPERAVERDARSTSVVTIYAGDGPALTTRVTVAPLASRIFPLGRWSRTAPDGRSDVFRITAPSEQ